MSRLQTVFVAAPVRACDRLLVVCLAALCSAIFINAAIALEPGEKEKTLLSSCEEKLCRQILDKSPPKGMLRCDLGKTWGKSDIDKGAKSKSIAWGFGDAQCSVELKIKRRDIIKALTARKYEFSVHPHHVSCNVETSDGVKPLKARLAPKLKFQGGKAKKVWIGLKDIDGPEPLSSFVWATAKLEDSLGIFHSEMISQINKFVHRKCERRYGEKAVARKRRRKAAQERRALAAKRRKARAARRAKLKAQREQQKANGATKKSAEEDGAPNPETPPKEEPAATAGAMADGDSGEHEQTGHR